MMWEFESVMENSKDMPKIINFLQDSTDSRKASVADPSLVSLTLDFCKTEFKVTAIYAAIVAGAVIFGLTGLLIFLPNAFQLPMKFYIFFLPIDGSPVNWAINYAFQLIDEFCALIFYLGYFCMTLILMNHSCWVIDSAVLAVHELGEKLLTDEIDKKAVRSDLELIIDESLAIIAWMNEARNIMRISFLAEISFLSSILCMGIFTFITNPFESIFALIVTMTVFSQLSVYCWMGSRVNSRIDDFLKALYNIRWDRMTPAQQKDLQMVLMMTQHIKGFDALFKSVDLRLFQNVNKAVLNFIKTFNNFFLTGIGSDLHFDDLAANNQQEVRRNGNGPEKYFGTSREERKLMFVF